MATLLLAEAVCRKRFVKLVEGRRVLRIVPRGALLSQERRRAQRLGSFAQQVEGVIVALERRVDADAWLLQEVDVRGRPEQDTRHAQLQLKVLAESGRVIVAHGARVAERLHHRARPHEPRANAVVGVRRGARRARDRGDVRQADLHRLRLACAALAADEDRVCGRPFCIVDTRVPPADECAECLVHECVRVRRQLAPLGVGVATRQLRACAADLLERVDRDDDLPFRWVPERLSGAAEIRHCVRVLWACHIADVGVNDLRREAPAQALQHLRRRELRQIEHVVLECKLVERALC
eukprot:6175137-Prymnesium_polylepis.1